jgi:hypothetical protein
MQEANIVLRISLHSRFTPCAVTRGSHSDGYKVYGVLDSAAVQFGDSPTFRRNVPPPSSKSKSKPSKKSAAAAAGLAAFLLMSCWLTLRSYRRRQHIRPKRRVFLSLPPASPRSLLGLLFNPQYGGNMFLRNVGLSPNYPQNILVRHRQGQTFYPLPAATEITWN